VQGGGVEFISKLKFKRIQIKFKSIQNKADKKGPSFAQFFLNKIWL
jgi:hypothetical protein